MSEKQQYAELFLNATSSTKLSVVTNVRLCVGRGGYGQHLRWLILLSENFTDVNTLNCPNFLVNKKYFPLKAEDRVDFIIENVYNYERNFNNWLTLEKFFQVKLHNYLGFCHDASLLKTSNDKTYYTIMGYTDVQSAKKHWYKFHPFWLGQPLKNSSEQEFIESTNNYNKLIENYVPSSNERTFYYNSKDLDNKVLNYDIYNNLVEFLGIDNRYEFANIVHEKWYDLNKKAERDIVEWFKEHQYPNLPWLEYSDSFQRVGTIEQFNNIKETVFNLYA